MFNKIWHGAIFAAILLYSGNIFFANGDCERINRSGSAIRVAATGIFFLSDNWMNKTDQIAVREKAHRLDLWLQEIVKVTIFGRALDCSGRVIHEKSGLQPLPAILQAPVEAAPDVPVIVNNNPFNLPSLPAEEKK